MTINGHTQSIGAFLIPWLLSIFLMGIPMFVLEVSLGQFLNTGGICIWNLVPMFKGKHSPRRFLDFCHFLSTNLH